MSDLLKNLGSNHAQRARQEGESLSEWFRFLPDEDREIMTMRYVDGLTVTRIASRANMNENGMRARISRIRRRINSRPFQLVALAGESLPQPLRAIAKYRVLHGLSLRAVARQLRMTLHHVRRRCDQLNVYLGVL